MKNSILALALMSAVAGAFADPAPAPAPVAEKAPAPAQPTMTETLKLWFQHWKDGLASSAVEGQYQQKSLTAVAAVRGDEQKLDDPNKPYIKGKLEAKQGQKLKRERAELGQAVDLILTGKAEEGAKKLDDFEAKHPKSALLGDVQKAREKLKELKALSSQ